MPLLDIISVTFEFIGTSIIAFTALQVHHRMLMEHKVDSRVFTIMKREQKIGFAGVALITTGYLLSLISYFIRYS